jgi:hypothetical protein
LSILTIDRESMDRCFFVRLLREPLKPLPLLLEATLLDLRLFFLPGTLDALLVCLGLCWVIENAQKRHGIEYA